MIVQIKVLPGSWFAKDRLLILPEAPRIGDSIVMHRFGSFYVKNVRWICVAEDPEADKPFDAVIFDHIEVDCIFAGEI